MAFYNVNLDCPRCGKRHGVYGGLWGGLPGVLVDLMTDTPWCDEVQEYVPMDDLARVHLTPKDGI